MLYLFLAFFFGPPCYTLLGHWLHARGHTSDPRLLVALFPYPLTVKFHLGFLEDTLTLWNRSLKHPDPVQQRIYLRQIVNFREWTSVEFLLEHHLMHSSLLSSPISNQLLPKRFIFALPQLLGNCIQSALIIDDDAWLQETFKKHPRLHSYVRDSIAQLTAHERVQQMGLS